MGEVITKNIMQFGKEKCSSNVVEKCFEVSTTGEHAKELAGENDGLFDAILLDHNGPLSAPLYQFMDDKFGNYIIHRMIEFSKGQRREILFQKINAYRPQEETQNLKRIHAALQKEMQNA